MTKKVPAAALAAAFLLLASPMRPAAAPERQTAVVAEALTGDTVRLRGGRTLRYIGLEAPPLQSKIPLLRAYGEDALAFNRALVEGKTVTLEWDSQLRDARNNLLAYVTLEDGRSVNEEILRSGHARVAVAPPNTRRAGSYRRAELEARRAKAGLWKEEPENPYLVSEYIGDMNTKIYHLPNSPELERIPQSYRVTFRSRVDAKAEGYRACDTCREDEPVE